MTHTQVVLPHGLKRFEHFQTHLMELGLVRVTLLDVVVNSVDQGHGLALAGRANMRF